MRLCPYLGLCGLSFTDEEWTRLGFADVLLAKFREVADLVQADQATIIDGINGWKVPRKHVKDMQTANKGAYNFFFAKAKKVLKDRSKEHLNDNVNVKALQLLIPQ